MPTRNAEKKSGTTESTQEEAILLSITEKVAAAAHDAIDQATPTLDKMEQRIRTASSSTGETLAETKLAAQENISKGLTSARLFARRNPLLTLSAAFGVGMLATALIRKRR